MKKLAVLMTIITALALLGTALVPFGTGRALPLGAPTNPGTTSLVSWWALDETSGTRADAHGSNTLSDNNTVGYDSGQQGNAASFVASNSEYLSRTDNASLSIGDRAYTWGTWFYVNSSANVTMYMYTKFDTNNEYTAVITGSGASRSIYVIASSDGINWTNTSAFSISADAWHYFMAWYDPDNDKLYLSIDNATPVSVTLSGGIYDGASLFMSNNPGSFDGRMDEMFVYTKLLSADEREWLYNSGAGRRYCEVADNCPTPTPTITLTPTITHTPTISATPTVTTTGTQVPPTLTYTPTVTETPTATQTATVTVTPTVTLTPSPTERMPTPALSNQLTYGDLLLSTIGLTIVTLLGIGLILYVTFTLLLRRK